MTGAEFAIMQKGRALIADEMGLGKTVQAIAAMSAFRQSWPLLVVTPSSARFHWEAEVIRWLGKDDDDDNDDDIFGNDDDDASDYGSDSDDERHPPIKPSQVQVLLNGNTKWSPKAKVVVVSYGLLPRLAANNFLKAKTFRSIIVDESHMIKNMKSQRTKTLLPMLIGASRCILLSGTPALACPIELYSQLKAVAPKEWDSEEHFI